MSPHIIKVCGITNVDDALAAVEEGATAIGFNFYTRSKRYLEPERAAAIAAVLPSGVIKVGVFVNETAASMKAIARQAGLDVAQLHGDEQPADSPSTLRTWKAYRVDPSFDRTRLDSFPDAEALLLDGPAGDEYGGSGKPFAWSVAAAVKRRIIIAGGLDAGNVGEAIALAHPWGVDACSRLESAPGKKDRSKMRDFLRAAKSAEDS